MKSAEIGDIVIYKTVIGTYAARTVVGIETSTAGVRDVIVRVKKNGRPLTIRAQYVEGITEGFPDAFETEGARHE